MVSIKSLSVIVLLGFGTAPKVSCFLFILF